MTTAATLEHHLHAIGQSIDAIMSDYSEESVLFTQQGVISGLLGIRQFFEQFVGNAPPELLAALTVTQQDVHGEFAYIVWKAEPFVSLASDTFVIRDGKIVAQSFVMLSP
jgi:ketosteroid isomerase-like protein